MLSILSFYKSLRYFAFNTTHVFPSYLPFSPLLSASAFPIHLGLDASCLQLPIFGIAERTPLNPFPPIRQAGKRPVTEFGGNVFVITLVSGDNLSSEIKKTLFKEEVYGYSHGLEDSTDAMTQERSCLRIHNDQDNFTKDLDNWLQAHPRKQSQLSSLGGCIQRG